MITKWRQISFCSNSYIRPGLKCVILQLIKFQKNKYINNDDNADVYEHRVWIQGIEFA